jgi:glycosyltransferase involved in cell wall biosynthesis
MTLMRIGYDLRRIQNPGIGRYMRQLIEAMMRVAPEHEYVFIVAPGTELLCHGNSQMVSTSARYYSVREQLVLPRIARDQRLDLLHSPHFLMPVASPCPVVVTIHDCIYIACPDDLGSALGRGYYRVMIQAAARRSARIITDSEYSKQDIIRYLKPAADKIAVIPCGVDAAFRPVTCEAGLQRVCDRYGITKDFIFYTAIYKPRKNHSGLLHAFSRVLQAGADVQLVLGGPLGDAHALRALARSLKVEANVIFAGLVPDRDLPALYSAARVYACPSTYEGFGFTVLEAMSCGTPVVCHSGTSLPEVGGSAPVYADARSPQEFADALLLVLLNDTVRDSVVKRGLEQAQRFDWDQTARLTLRLYNEVLNCEEARKCA